MNSVLFGESYYLRFDPKLYSQMQPYPPLGTLYAASYIREKGYSVQLFDAMLADSEEQWAAALERYAPRYAVLFEDNFNYLTKMCLVRMRQAAYKMISMAKCRGCVVIVNGSDATDHYDEYMARGADYVLIGEGEVTLGELLDSLERPGTRALEQVRGLVWHDETGGHRSAAREFIRDLDGLPFPAWDLVDIPRYRETWLKHHNTYSMNMVTTRGCPYHCNWCAKPIYGQRYNVRSPENVASELEWLVKQYSPQHIWFADDIFGLKPGWIERYAEQLHTKNCAVPFKCLLRADLVKPASVAALSRAHCQTVWIGAESGSQKILDAMDKGTTVAQIRSACTQLHDAGIRVGFFLQFGYSGEDRSDIDKTIQMVRECRPDEIGISVSYPLPGTKFFERVKEQLGEKRNWIDSDDLAMMYHATFIPPFYRVLYKAVHYEFRIQKEMDRLRKMRSDSAIWRTAALRSAVIVLGLWLKLRIARFRLDKLALVKPGRNSPLEQLPQV